MPIDIYRTQSISIINTFNADKCQSMFIHIIQCRPGIAYPSNLAETGIFSFDPICFFTSLWFFHPSAYLISTVCLFVFDENFDEKPLH